MGIGKIHILHTNDVHSHFEHVPHIAGAFHQFQKELKQKEEEVILVDLGDNADRMSPITEATMGKANIEIMNHMGYQLASIGNNEGLTFPKEKVLSLYDQAQFQVLCCNLLDQDTGCSPPHMKPYSIQSFGGLRICWISATAKYPVYNLLGWDVRDPIPQIKKIVNQVRGQYDILVILSHLGYRADQIMAEEIAGIDLIIGAHTHHLLEDGVYINDTFIIQAGKFGQYVGHTTIEFNRATKQKIKVSGKCFPSSDFPKDPEIEKLIHEKQKQADEILSPSIVDLSHDFPIHWQKESPLGNLLAKGIRDWVGTEVALVNAGQLLFSLRRGPVTKKDLLSLCPHPINPCKLKLKGHQIVHILEDGLKQENIHRPIKGLGFRGKVLGWICVDGMTITYDLNQEEGKRILDIQVNGHPLQLNQRYSVGTIDMFTFGGYIFPMFKQAEEVEYFLPEFIRDVLSRELENQDALERSSDRRWIHI